MSSDEVIRVAGLDAFVYIRLFAIFARILTVSALVSCCVLLPINYQFSQWAAWSEYGYSRDMLSSLSIASVDDGDALWAHTAVAVAFTFYVLFEFRLFWQTFVQLRHNFLIERFSQGERLSLLVLNLPPSVATDLQLFTMFQRVHHDAVVAAHVVRDTTILPELLELRQEARRQLEVAHAIFNTNKTKGITTRPTTSMFDGSVDAIDYWSSQLDTLNRSVGNLLAAQPPPSLSPSSATLYRNVERFRSTACGFVTFRSAMALQAALQMKHRWNGADGTYDQFRHNQPNPPSTILPTTDDRHIILQHAPQPTDVYWPALRVHFTDRSTRRLIVYSCMFGLLLLWNLPIYVAQVFAHMSAASSRYSFLSPDPALTAWLISLMQSIIPPLLIALCLALLPLILRRLVQYESIEAISWQSKSVLAKYYIFIIFNFFVASAIFSSVFEVLPLLTKKPTALVKLLGHAIPSVSTFFVTFIILKSFTMMPLQLLRAVYFITDFVKYKFSRTRRELKEAMSVQPIDYGAEYPDHLLIFVVACSYSVIAPMVLPFAALYFALGYLVFKYQLLYVYVPTRFETGGTFWPLVFPRAIFGLVLAQVVLIGLLLLKSCPLQATVIFMLPIITLVVYQRWKTTYATNASYLSAEQCSVVDGKLASVDMQQQMMRGGDADYEEPELRAEPHLTPDLWPHNLDISHDKVDTKYSDTFDYGDISNDDEQRQSQTKPLLS